MNTSTLTLKVGKLAFVPTLQERIAEIMSSTGLTVGEIASITGVSSSAVTQWKDGQTKSIKTGPATKLAAHTGYSALWIGEGEGPMHPGPVPISMENNPDYPAIRRVHFKLSAGASGFGVDYEGEDAAPIVFRREWYERNGYQPGKLLAVRVSNGSMEPGLYDGDTVVVNTADTTPTDGAVFAVNYEGEMVIKRLVRDSGQWWLASDNPDQRRYPRKVCDEHAFLLGRIVHKQSEKI